MTQGNSLHNAFALLEHGLQSHVEEKIIDTISISSLPLTILDWPSRSLEYMDIPKLTFIGDPFAFFLLGCVLINRAKYAQTSSHLFLHLNVTASKKSKISNFIIDVWRRDDVAIGVDFFENHQIQLERDFSWLSPLEKFNLSEIDQPVAGILGGFSKVLADLGAKADGSTAYFGASVAGAAAMGKTLLIFATEQGDSIQFEQTLDGGGMGRKSYEIECHKTGSFAAESLLL